MKIRIHRCIELVHIPYITAQITKSKFLQTGPLENYRSAHRHVLEYSQSLISLYCILYTVQLIRIHVKQRKYFSNVRMYLHICI